MKNRIMSTNQEPKRNKEESDCSFSLVQNKVLKQGERVFDMNANANIKYSFITQSRCSWMSGYRITATEATNLPTGSLLP